MSQAKGEPAKFQSTFGEILINLNPEYKRNTSARGVRTEYLREIQKGLYITQSAFCMKGTYYHCFCLTVHKEIPNPYLRSPFTIGGRFDHNYTIQRAISDMQDHHIVMSCSHKFRTGWEDIVKKCTSEAEAILLPYYWSFFQDSKKTLLHLAEYINNELGDVEKMPQPHGSGYIISRGDCDMIRFVEMYKQSNSPHALIKEIAFSKADMFETLKKQKAIYLPLLEN